jgi:hypothetical protein
MQPACGGGAFFFATAAKRGGIMTWRIVLKLSLCIMVGFALLGAGVDLIKPAKVDQVWTDGVDLVGTAWAGKKRDRASAKHKADCEAWCKANENCQKCSRSVGCGTGYKKLKSWTGYGDNWYACGKNKYGQASDKHKEACQKWCKGQRKCAFCSKKSGCGTGYKKMKSWTGRGKNWYACKKSGSINKIWPGTGAAKKQHTVLVVAAGGSGASTSDDGIEWFCEDFFKGSKYSNVLCISSWGSITTRSKTLSNNIADLASAMKKKSGKDPKIILIGKSMGACKLHHAAAGTKSAKKGKLRKRKIDLFVGVDMSCGVDRHFEDGKKDALYFKDNIKKLIVFYQEKRGESQTGSQGIYKGKKFNKNIHINVNKDRFDVQKEVRTPRHDQRGMCKNVGHMDIDDCEALRKTIYKLVIKRAK